MKFSKRELFLVFFLGLVTIIGLMIAFVILPEQKRLDENRIILEQLQDQKAKYESVLPVLAKNKETLAQRLEFVGAKMNLIATPLNEAQFDQWVSPLLVNYKMKVIDAKFDEPFVVKPTALEMLYSAPNYEIKKLVDEFNQIDSTANSHPTTESQLLMSVHSYKFNSTYENYRSLLNEIAAWDTSIYVVHTYYDFAKQEALVTFNVYTIEKLVPEANPKTYKSQ